MPENIMRFALTGLAICFCHLTWGENISFMSDTNKNLYVDNASATEDSNALNPYFDFENSRELENRHITNSSETIRYKFLVDKIARIHQIDKNLLHAIVSVESRYNPNAHSRNGAIGLMQLMPSTARRYGVVNAYDPEQNLHGGAKHLRDLLNMFGSDIRIALAAYHAGEYAVIKHKNKIPPFKSTNNFVSRVMERYHIFRTESTR